MLGEQLEREKVSVHLRREPSKLNEVRASRRDRFGRYELLDLPGLRKLAIQKEDCLPARGEETFKGVAAKHALALAHRNCNARCGQPMRRRRERPRDHALDDGAKLFIAWLRGGGGSGARCEPPQAAHHAQFAPVHQQETANINPSEHRARLQKPAWTDFETKMEVWGDENERLRARARAWMESSGCTDVRELGLCMDARERGDSGGARSGRFLEEWLSHKRELSAVSLGRVDTWLSALERGECESAIGPSMFDPIWPRLELLSDEASRALSEMLSESASARTTRSADLAAQPAKRARAGAGAGRQAQKGRMIGVVLEEILRHEVEQLVARLGGGSEVAADRPALVAPDRMASLADSAKRVSREWRGKRGGDANTSDGSAGQQPLQCARKRPRAQAAPHAAPPFGLHQPAAAGSGVAVTAPPALDEPVMVPPTEGVHRVGRPPSGRTRLLWRCPHAVLCNGRWICVFRSRPPAAGTAEGDGAGAGADTAGTAGGGALLPQQPPTQQPGEQEGETAEGPHAPGKSKRRRRGLMRAVPEGYRLFYVKRTAAEVAEHLRTALHVPLALPLSSTAVAPARVPARAGQGRAAGSGESQGGGVAAAALSTALMATAAPGAGGAAEGEEDEAARRAEQAEHEETEEGELPPVPAGRTLVRIVKPGRLFGREGLLEAKLPGCNRIQVRLGRWEDGGALVVLRKRELVCVQNGARVQSGGPLLPIVPDAPVPATAMVQLASGRLVPTTIYSPSAAAFLAELARDPTAPPRTRPKPAAPMARSAAFADCGECGACLTAHSGEPCERPRRIPAVKSHAGRRCVAVGCERNATRGMLADPERRAYFCGAHAPQGSAPCSAREKQRQRAVQGLTACLALTQ